MNLKTEKDVPSNLPDPPKVNAISFTPEYWQQVKALEEWGKLYNIPCIVINPVHLRKSFNEGFMAKNARDSIYLDSLYRLSYGYPSGMYGSENYPSGFFWSELRTFLSSGASSNVENPVSQEKIKAVNSYLSEIKTLANKAYSLSQEL